MPEQFSPSQETASAETQEGSLRADDEISPLQVFSYLANTLPPEVFKRTLHNQFASAENQLNLPKQISNRIENLGFYNRYIDSEEHVFFLANALRTNRRERERIIGNPFNSENQTALQDIAMTHGLEDVSRFDAVRAFVLSQPHGMNSSIRNKLMEIRSKQAAPSHGVISAKERQQVQQELIDTMVFEQLNHAADAVMRVTDYVQTHEAALWDMSDEDLYQRLSSLVFQDIQTPLTPNQHMELQLGILNTIQGIHIMAGYRDRLTQSPQQTLDEIFNGSQTTPEEQQRSQSDQRMDLAAFIDIPEITVYPDSIVITLTDEDYINVTGSPFSAGATLSYLKGMPKELRGNVIVIPKSKKNSEGNEYKYEDIIMHERKHAVYRNIFASVIGENVVVASAFTKIPHLIARITDETTFQKIYQGIAETIGAYEIETMKNEIISHHHNNNLPRSASAKVNDGLMLESALKSIESNTELTPQQSRTLLDLYETAYGNYFVEKLRLVTIAQALYTDQKVPTQRAEALLQVATVEQVNLIAEKMGILDRQTVIQPAAIPALDIPPQFAVEHNVDIVPTPQEPVELFEIHPFDAVDNASEFVALYDGTYALGRMGVSVLLDEYGSVQGIAVQPTDKAKEEVTQAEYTRRPLSISMEGMSAVWTVEGLPIHSDLNVRFEAIAANVQREFFAWKQLTDPPPFKEWLAAKRKAEYEDFIETYSHLTD